MNLKSLQERFCGGSGVTGCGSTKDVEEGDESRSVEMRVCVNVY